MLISITVNELPRGKQRPRHSRFGSQNTYTPAQTVSFEQAVRFAGMAAMDGRPPLGRYAPGYTLLMSAFMPIPKSWPLEKRYDAYVHRIRPTGKPDFDNLLKTIDALNGVVFGDDAAVTDGRVLKWYAESNPFLIIEVWPTPLGQSPHIGRRP